MTPARARDITVEVATEAAALVMQGLGRAQEITAKELATDLVTEWDTRAEDLIIQRLVERAPGVAIVGEERGARGTGGARFVVDPIDGTVNFAHALPIFGVSIGYEEDGRGVAGCVVAPALGWTWAAARGEGATLNGRAIRVSETQALSRAMLATGFPYDRAVSPRNNFGAWEHMQRVAGACRRLGAASLDCCFVATGWLDGYWEIKLKPWDISAGALICEEAGGRVTGLDGGPFSSEAGELIASNGRIHEDLVRELRGRT